MAEVTVCTADPYNQCCSQYRSQGANKGESVIREQESEGERYAEFYNTNNLLFQTMASTLRNQTRKKQSEQGSEHTHLSECLRVMLALRGSSQYQQIRKTDGESTQGK